LSLFAFIQFSFSQKLNLQIIDNKHFLPYQKPHDSIALIWADFMATTKATDAWSAVTNTNTEYSARIQKTKENIKAKYTFKFYFNKKLSNKKPNTTSEYILRHEQIHFDIAWYHYQLFLKQIRATPFTAQNYSSEIKKMFTDYLATTKAMQDAYDEETNHSIDQEKQKEWDAKVVALLLEL
jgi:predicted secreted Zn-dependent protease